MRSNKYSKEILEILKKGKSVPHFSITDYLDPIRFLYSKLSKKEKKEFHASLLQLLQGRNYLEALIDICIEVKLKEACPILKKIFSKPPRNLKEDGHPVWIEGLRRHVVYAFGELECKKAKSLLIDLLYRGIVRKKWRSSSKFSVDTYYVIMQALTKISAKDASKFFGWWLREAQQIEGSNKAFVKGLDEWKILEEMNVAPDIDSCTSGSGASSVRICVFYIAEKYKIEGLKTWLKTVTLLNPKDRRYLRLQIQYSLEGKDELFNLKNLLNFKGNAKSLAAELADLPLLKRI